MKKYHLLLFFILLQIACKKEPLALSQIKGKRIAVSNKIKSNKVIDSFIKPFKEKIDKSMGKILSYASKNMHKKDGELESTVGNLMADIVHQQAQPIFHKRTGKSIDFTLLNYGGIRSGISKGPVTTRTAFELMPFENSIVVVELTAKKVNQLITYLAKGKKAHPISHLTIELDKDYNLKKARINGKKINKNRTYFVATNDYLQHGGDRMNFFSNPVSLHVLDYKIRNALLDSFQKIDTLPAILDNRFIRSKN